MVSHAQFPRHEHADTILMATILLSLTLHAAAFGLLPDFFKGLAKPAEQLTVELLPPPPPKPAPPPEPPKPEPEKPKPLPKRVLPPPKPLPVIQPKAETPPPVHTPEPPPPPQVIAAAPKASEPTPAVTVPPPQPVPVAETKPRPMPLPPPDLEVVRSNYGSVLSREFAKHKQYPRVAQMRGWQGTSRIELQIDATGTVTAINILESSGFEILDKQAIESVQKALPLPPIPEELRGKDFTIVVPMKFSLQ